MYLDEITEDMVTDVVSGGYDLNEPLDEYNRTLLFFACQSGQANKIKLLLKYGADPNISTKGDVEDKGMTPLMKAVSEWVSPNTMDIETIRALIKAGAKVNAQTERGNTALMYAASMPRQGLSSDIIRLLIESGADVKIKTKNGRNVLFSLSYELEPEIVKLLLEKGADPKQKDADGATPLMVQCKPDIIKILIDAGTDVSARTKDGKTALIVLPEFCHDPASYQHLVEAGADINAKDKDGRNALYYAVHYRQFDVSKYLIKAGIDVNAKDNEGKTVIETLEPSPDTPDLVRMLQEAGATGTPQPGWDIEMFYEE
jgi:ankyrin repeat protein